MPHPPIVIKAVGHEEASKAALTAKAMDTVSKQISGLNPDVLVVISPHGPLFSDAIAIRGEEILSGNLADFGAPQIELKKYNDMMLVNTIIEKSEKEGIPVVKFDHKLARRFDASNALDHGILVPLSFLKPYDFDYKLVAITYGLLSPDELYRFGKVIAESVDALNLSAVVIASGDLSHRLKDSGPYQYDARGPEFDDWIMKAFNNGHLAEIVAADDALCEGAGECGKKSIDIMIGTLDGLEVRSEVLSYEGPFGVGYGVAALTHPEFSEGNSRYQEILDALAKQRSDRLASEDAYVSLARKAINTFVESHVKISSPDNALSGELSGPSKGAFVSIKNPGGLRGCIGSTAGTQPTLAAEIISNAINAATQDPRFPEVEPWELENLIITVDILSEGERIPSIQQLNPKKYGVIVESGFRRGLLLPDLEGINTAEEQIKIALNKAGIKENEKYQMFRFTVERHV